MKTYCTNCGFKIEHQASQKPNFCPKCGTPLGNQSDANLQQDTQEEQPEENPERSLDLNEGFELDVEIMERPQQRNKLSDLMGTSNQRSPSSEKQKKRRGRPKKINKEEVWKDFKDEAGGNPHRQENQE